MMMMMMMMTMTDHSGARRGRSSWAYTTAPLTLTHCLMVSNLTAVELNAMILDVVSFQIDQIVTPEYRAHRGLFRDTGCPPNAKN